MRRSGEEDAPLALSHLLLGLRRKGLQIPAPHQARIWSSTPRLRGYCGVAFAAGLLIKDLIKDIRENAAGVVVIDLGRGIETDLEGNLDG